MAKPTEVLARLFRRNPKNTAVANLHLMLAQPLLVHPQLGERVVSAYLNADMPSIKAVRSDKSGEYSQAVVVDRNIAVIDISGPLTAREENVPCEESPASYEVIKQDMRALLADRQIDTIIGRFDTPGGVASQNIDLSDFIYSSRGQGVKLIAMVDDMAYSAGFAIASAFDEIWVTRTSGVGSVGVVSYHVDQSEANRMAGVKVEYIFAGDKKVLGNPHEPLTDAGRQEYKREVTRLYSLFVSTVARNLGMTVDAVSATEAGTFHGSDAIGTGFAHKMGTFDDLLASLGDARSPQSVKSDHPMADSFVSDISGPDADVIAPEAGEVDGSIAQAEPNVAPVAAAIEEKIVADTTAVDAIVADAAIADNEAYEASIRGLCMVAGQPEAAKDLIASKTSAKDVSAMLLTLSSSKDDPILGAQLLPLTQQDNVKEIWREAYRSIDRTFK